ncbi:hypothetical protein [Silvimonas sp.]|uniref:hypothetical protein n=1 Tax=Silvimonas sp. TaxID=2650811 RepID=UPI00284DCF2B|nr:hypothetical protein [Silvimonas sp.]MDR3427805.1 hypothetical protein [Silvimonas sp.]
MMDLSAPIAWLVNEAEGIPHWVLTLAPILAAVLTWHAALAKNRQERRLAEKQFAFEKQKMRKEWDDKSVERRQQEQSLVHTENAAQTQAWTERFTKLMDGYDARVEDLMQEVVELRKEVLSLRRILDWQRQACVGCPKLSKFVEDQANGAV